MTSLGKLPPDALRRIVTPRLGADRAEVLVGPQPGTDAAIVRLGAGRIMAVTTDPLSLIPPLGAERSARLACHLVASDLWTTGIPPAFASVCLNLSPAFADDELERYLDAMHEAWRELGVSVVTGHTGRHEGCSPTLLGSATLMGAGDESRYVGPQFAGPGDRVLITRSCGIEAAVIAAWAFPQRLAKHLSDAGVRRLQSLLDQLSVVEDCQVALRVGVRDRGVTLMHDATEGGVLGGLFEVAGAVGCDLRVERARIPLADDVRSACAALDLDPYTVVSEGALIALVRPEHAEAVLAEFEGAGIDAADAGELVAGTGRLWLTEADGEVTRLDQSPVDPWWALWSRAMSEGWS